VPTHKTSWGTEGYAPIEQCQGEPEVRSDLYALAATMHHLLSGRPPVPFRFPPVRMLRPDVSPAMEAVLERALKLHADERYGTVRASSGALTATGSRRASGVHRAVGSRWTAVCLTYSTVFESCRNVAAFCFFIFCDRLLIRLLLPLAVQDRKEVNNMNDDFEYVKDNFEQKVSGISDYLPFISDAIAMYKLLTDPCAEWTEKAIVIGALAYFIMPLDAVVDFIPMAGYLDDAAVIAAARAVLDTTLEPYM